jgi:hypothetical protein
MLRKFTDLLGGKDKSGPPYAIPAKMLDENFAACQPIPQDGNSRQYAVTYTPNGWQLTIFPAFPSGTSEPSFLVFANGQLAWTGQPQPGQEGDGQALRLVEVERCDGKKMMVLGTGWYE